LKSSKDQLDAEVNAKMPDITGTLSYSKTSAQAVKLSRNCILQQFYFVRRVKEARFCANREDRKG
jgi:hypothetical protein